MEVRIGAADPRRPHGEMEPVFYGFALLGIPALRRCAQAPGEWFTMNEIGYLDFSCPEYSQEITALMEKKRMIAGIRRQDLPLYQALIHRPDVFLVNLDDPFGDLACVIMASGLGRRFGSNKLMASFRGEPMIARILEATEGVFARRVVVTRHPEAAAWCRERGVAVRLHDLPLRSDTVRLGTETAADSSGCLFCPADQPLLTGDTVKALVLCARNFPDRIWRPAADGVPGAPILFPRDLYPQLCALPEGKGGAVLAERYPERVSLLKVDARELADADTPEALAALE